MFFIDILDLSRDWRRYEVTIRFSFLLSASCMKTVYFLFSLSMKHSRFFFEICSIEIRSKSDFNVDKKSLYRWQLSFYSCALELTRDQFVQLWAFWIIAQFIRYSIACSAYYRRHAFDSHAISCVCLQSIQMYVDKDDVRFYLQNCDENESKYLENVS
jgi:hypothetical protein